MKTSRFRASAAMSVAILGAFMLAAGGCGQRRVDPPAQPATDLFQYPQIALSPDLAGWVAVDRPIVSRGEDGRGPLRVTVPVRTLTKHQTMRVDYKFTFMDSLGRPIDPQPDWRYERMPSRTQRFFEANALDNRAEDWRLEIRAAQ